MLVETLTCIDGTPVREVFRKHDMIIFQSDRDEEHDNLFYFVKSGEVIFTQKITADCGQNTGYISGVEFKGVN